jgi:GT2 family glycosyltransferase
MRAGDSHGDRHREARGVVQKFEPEPGSAITRERVAAVVLNWNGWRDTVACLESLRRLDVVPRVIVVDNGSTDGSADRIRAEAPWAQLVQLPSNRGFSCGMNSGIAAALNETSLVDYVWILNNDTLVEPSTLSCMLALGDSDARIGIIGCRLVDADGSGRVQAMGGGGINRWLGTTSTDLEPSPRACDHLVGASLFARKTLLGQVGGFDERYFFYLEDTDLSLRARRAGWRLAVAEDATVIHRRGASIGGDSPGRSLRSDVNMARSSAIFMSSLGLPWMVTAIPLRLAGMLANRLARFQVDRLLPITRAYLEGLRIGRRSPVIPFFDDVEHGKAIASGEQGRAAVGEGRSNL